MHVAPRQPRAMRGVAKRHARAPCSGHYVTLTAQSLRAVRAAIRRAVASVLTGFARAVAALRAASTPTAAPVGLVAAALAGVLLAELVRDSDGAGARGTPCCWRSPW